MRLGMTGQMIGGGMSEPTLTQYLRDEVEEIIFPADVTGSLRIALNGTNLKRVDHLGFGLVGAMTVPTAVLTSGGNKEFFRMPINLNGDGIQNATKMLEAHVYKVSAVGAWAFYGVGTQIESGKTCNVYATQESASTIQSRANEVGKQQWNKNIVFHGNDGNKVTYNSGTSEWEISPDD